VARVPTRGQEGGKKKGGQKTRWLMNQWALLGGGGVLGDWGGKGKDHIVLHQNFLEGADKADQLHHVQERIRGGGVKVLGVTKWIDRRKSKTR